MPCRRRPLIPALLCIALAGNCLVPQAGRCCPVRGADGDDTELSGGQPAKTCCGSSQCGCCQTKADRPSCCAHGSAKGKLAGGAANVAPDGITGKDPGPLELGPLELDALNQGQEQGTVDRPAALCQCSLSTSPVPVTANSSRTTPIEADPSTSLVGVSSCFATHQAARGALGIPKGPPTRSSLCVWRI